MFATAPRLAMNTEQKWVRSARSQRQFASEAQRVWARNRKIGQELDRAALRVSG
jgi:hypothetical protein